MCDRARLRESQRRRWERKRASVEKRRQAVIDRWRRVREEGLDDEEEEEEDEDHEQVQSLFIDHQQYLYTFQNEEEEEDNEEKASPAKTGTTPTSHRRRRKKLKTEPESTPPRATHEEEEAEPDQPTSDTTTTTTTTEDTTPKKKGRGRRKRKLIVEAPDQSTVQEDAEEEPMQAEIEVPPPAIAPPSVAIESITPVVETPPKSNLEISLNFLTHFLEKRGRKKKVVPTIEEVSREISQAVTNVFATPNAITTTTTSLSDPVGQLKGILEQAVGKLGEIQEETEKLRRKSISEHDKSFDDLSINELTEHEKELQERLKEIQKAKVTKQSKVTK